MDFGTVLLILPRSGAWPILLHMAGVEMNYGDDWPWWISQHTAYVQV